MNTLLLLVLVILFATGASAWAGAVRSAALRRKFESLGKIVGREKSEILRHVGEPHRRAPLGDGREVMMWRRINFRVALSFSGEVCDGVDYDAG